MKKDTALGGFVEKLAEIRRTKVGRMLCGVLAISTFVCILSGAMTLIGQACCRSNAQTLEKRLQSGHFSDCCWMIQSGESIDLPSVTKRQWESLFEDAEIELLPSDRKQSDEVYFCLQFRMNSESEIASDEKGYYDDIVSFYYDCDREEFSAYYKGNVYLLVSEEIDEFMQQIHPHPHGK